MKQKELELIGKVIHSLPSIDMASPFMVEINNSNYVFINSKSIDLSTYVGSHVKIRGNFLTFEQNNLQSFNVKALTKIQKKEL